MNSCQPHWEQLREAIAKRGLMALVPVSGETAARNIARQVVGEEPTIDNFDPLMSAHFAIASNGMDFIADCGGNPLVLMSQPDPDNPLPFAQCTICYLNWMMDEHDRTCHNPACLKPKGELAHYEWMIDRAADDAVDAWKRLGSG